jgi:hypothetical protein
MKVCCIAIMSALISAIFFGGLPIAKADPFNQMLGRNTPPDNTRSLFDHLMFKKDPSGNGYSYQVPATFEELIRELTGANGGIKPTIVMFPDGRSLQRKIATFNSPRLVVAFDKMPEAGSNIKALLRDRLYMGFVDVANQIEVISYNEGAGRFEYQLVLDYDLPGVTPRVVYAQRGFCMSCHQGAGTIFSLQPWMESNGFTDPAGLSPVNEKLKHDLAVTMYRGVDISHPASPYDFDNSTERANYFLIWQRLWREGCGLEDNSESRNCRARILAVALQKTLYPDDREFVAQERTDLLTYWKGRPAAEIKLLLHHIANRNPFASQVDKQKQQSDAEAASGVSASEAQAFRDELARGGQGSESQKLVDLLADSRFPGALDPLVPRRNYWFNPKTKDLPLFNEEEPLVHLINGISVNYFTATERKLLRTKPFVDVKKAIVELANDSAGPFGPENFKRPKILGQLFAKLGIDAGPICCEVSSDMPPVVAVQKEGPVVIGDQRDPMSLFRGYCDRCHINPEHGLERVDFFPEVAQSSTGEGPIKDDWLQLLQKGGLVCLRLNWEHLGDRATNPAPVLTEMPPSGNLVSTYKELQASAKDRMNMLIQYRLMATRVSEDSAALARMVTMRQAASNGNVNSSMKTKLKTEIIENPLCFSDMEGPARKHR